MTTHQGPTEQERARNIRNHEWAEERETEALRYMRRNRDDHRMALPDDILRSGSR